MKKFTKVISTMLVMALVIAMATVMTFAAEAESITVITPPDRTVYYDGIDNYDTEIWCDPTGMVLEVTFDDGSTELIIVDEYSYVDMTVYDYVIGENEAEISFYGTDDYDAYLTTTMTVTVEESPVASVEITKMPTKTEYDMDADVLTRDNFTLDKLYEMEPEMMDEMLADMGMTFDEMKAFYEENPDYYELMLDIMFDETEEILLVDTEGMEILVTFSDGSTATLTDADDYVVYNGVEIPVYVEQVESTVAEGENELLVVVGDKSASFSVTVVANEDDDIDNDVDDNTNDDTTNTDKNDNKNPVIPNTDGGVSVVASAVIALASGFGMALIPSKKEK